MCATDHDAVVDIDRPQRCDHCTSYDSATGIVVDQTISSSSVNESNAVLEADRDLLHHERQRDRASDKTRLR